jgi:hypothetical protein
VACDEPGRSLKSGSRARLGGSPDISVLKCVLQFAIVSRVPMAVLAVLLVWNLDRQATAQAIEEEEHDTREVARAVVEPDLPLGLVTGDRTAIAAWTGWCTSAC